MDGIQEAALITDARIVEVPIEKLKLDTTNVRLIHFKRDLKQEEAEKILKEIGNVSELCQQILADGVVYEPLIVDSNFTVVEGNRRLVALRTLQEEVLQGKHEDIPAKTFAKVKCKILPEDISDKSIDLFLATIHVRGKKPWKLFNRAKHIYRLNRTHKISYDQLAERLGMGKITIQRAITSYILVLEYSREYPDDKKWFEKFSYFDELYKRKDLKEDRENKKFVSKFNKWIYEKKFQDYQDLRKLKLVIMNSDAFAELEKHDFKAALRVLEEDDPSLSNRDFKKIKDTIDALKSISRVDLEEIRSNSSKIRLIYQLEAELKSLISDLESKKGIKKMV